MPVIEFTVAFRPTAEAGEGSWEPPSEMKEMLRWLNGKKSRKRRPLPRFVGVVPALSCSVRGESEEELIANARRVIEGTARIRTNRAKIASEEPPVFTADIGDLDVTTFPTGTKVVTVLATIEGGVE